MKERIESLDIFVSESALFEGMGNETYVMNGENYTVDFIKVKPEDRHSSPSYHLLLKNATTGETLAWPDVFWYEEGWSQGTNRSERGWYLTAKFYGSVGNGSGISSPRTPMFVQSQLEFFTKAYMGKGWNKEQIDWFQENVQKFPKGTKKPEMERSLSRY